MGHCTTLEYEFSFVEVVTWGIVVGILTRYGLDGPGIESR